MMPKKEDFDMEDAEDEDKMALEQETVRKRS